MTVTVDARFKLRGTLAADAASGNPVPLDREMWVETDQGLTDGKYKVKIGDGSTHYNDLPYVQLGGGVESIVPGSHIAVDDTDPKNPAVSVTGLSAGAGYAEGTSFPASPGLNDKFYRNDLNFLCYYDGTRWLTAQEFCEPPALGPLTDSTGAISATSYFRWPYAVRQIFVTKVQYSIFLGVANTSSNYWSFAFQHAPANNSNTTFASFDTKGLSNILNVGSLTVNSALPALTAQVRAVVTPNGSPGIADPSMRLCYRLIVT